MFYVYLAGFSEQNFQQRSLRTWKNCTQLARCDKNAKKLSKFRARAYTRKEYRVTIELAKFLHTIDDGGGTGAETRDARNDSASFLRPRDLGGS